MSSFYFLAIQARNPFALTGFANSSIGNINVSYKNNL
jgi:hypothetical protein